MDEVYGVYTVKNDPYMYHRPEDEIRSDTGKGMVRTCNGDEEVDLQERGYVRSTTDPAHLPLSSSPATFISKEDYLFFINFINFNR